MAMTTQLRQRLDQGRLLHAPAVYDCLSAKLAEHSGFEALVISGFSYMAASTGLPDVGVETRADILDATRRIVAAVRIPVVVDASEGYGGPAGLFHTVRGLEQAGAAGMLLGDQTSPAVCPMLGPPDVVVQDMFVAKIAFAREACSDPDFVIIARTDAAARYGVEDAISRACAYYEAGADLVLPIAGIPRDRAGLHDVVRRIGAPVAVASAPDLGLTVSDYEALGIRMVSGLEMLFAAADGMKRALDELKANGAVANPERHSASPEAVRQLGEMMGWNAWLKMNCQF